MLSAILSAVAFAVDRTSVLTYLKNANANAEIKVYAAESTEPPKVTSFLSGLGQSLALRAEWSRRKISIFPEK